MHFLSSTYDIKEDFKEHFMVFKGVFYLYNITINTPSTVSKYLWSKMVDCYIPFKGIIQDEKIKNRNLMYKKVLLHTYVKDIHIGWILLVKNIPLIKAFMPLNEGLFPYFPL